MGLKSLEAP